MTWITPESVPYMMVGTACMLLAAWMLGIDASSRVNRVFAALLVLRGVAMVTGPIKQNLEIGQAQYAFFHFFPYILIPLGPIILYFLSLYPRPRGVLGTTRWAPWTLAGLTAAAMLWYALDHSVYAEPIVGRTQLFYDYNWMGVLGTSRIPMLALAAFILSRDFRKNPTGSLGFSTFLVAVGFTISAVFDGILFTSQMWLEGSAIGFATLVREDWIATVVPTLALPLGAMAVTEMVRAMRANRHDHSLQEVRWFVWIGAPLAIASGALAGYAEFTGTLAATEFLRGFWNLLGPATIAYALLRYNLFDMDIRLKAGVRRGIVIGAFTLTFVVVLEAAENLVTGDRGPLAGLAAASLLAVTARPMQHVARIAADRLMPDTPDWHALSPAGRQRMYREQFLLVRSDGIITPKERRMLRGLAEALHLEDAVVRALEKDPPKISDDQQPVAPPKPRIRRKGRVGRSILLGAATAMVFGIVSQLGESLFNAGDFLVSLAAATIIGLLLGPLENLAMRLDRSERFYDDKTLDLYRQELAAALDDGRWTRRDRRYMLGLAEHLGLDVRTRTRLERDAFSAAGMPRWRRMVPVASA